jgi:hypothetical protein
LVFTKTLETGVSSHIRQASLGYTQKAYVLKLDFRGFLCTSAGRFSTVGWKNFCWPDTGNPTGICFGLLSSAYPSRHAGRPLWRILETKEGFAASEAFFQTTARAPKKV